MYREFKGGNYILRHSVFLQFGHHPHPEGYLCAKFRFFCGPIAKLARGKKSLTHSPSLFDLVLLIIINYYLLLFSIIV